MIQNILIAGVGGQGILSVAGVICNAALDEGLNFKQSEVHGMAQRGGAVQAHLRISDQPIASDLIPRGRCDLLISVEPMEALRYIQFLQPEGRVVTSLNPFENIASYPEMNLIWEDFEAKVKHLCPIDTLRLAQKAGSALAQGMVILGAASNFLEIKESALKTWVKNLWQPKGEKVVKTNLEAFRLGREMAGSLDKAARSGSKQADLRAMASP